MMKNATYRELMMGDHAPWFRQRSTRSSEDAIDLAAGRYLVLCFFGYGGEEGAQRRLVAAQRQQSPGDSPITFFGVSVDPADEWCAGVRDASPSIHHFWDFDGHVSRLYGALPTSAGDNRRESFRARWIVLNPNLQVCAVLPFGSHDSDVAQLTELLLSLPALTPVERVEMHAPVLVLPDIFDAPLCHDLIEQYDRHGGKASGFMREEDRMTVVAHDPRHKVRSDHTVNDSALRQRIQLHVARKVAPAIWRAFQFDATRMERYLVGCYDSSDGGHFRPHRDNSTRGTAHRRFALSINLNDDFDGGELMFPEFGPKGFKAPPGAGVVFGCSLLHCVTPVVRGRRYAFLPFLYDDKAAAIRVANRRYLVDGEPPALQNSAS
jgi:predicted 2-oxoglutarate/Fe(II)-dependent dioxygenase YbiX